MSASTPGDLLATIVAATRRTTEVRQQRVPAAALGRLAEGRVPAGQLFYDSVSRSGRLNVIAECKRRSPSRGVLRADYDPVAIASGYSAAGAAGISVLTEPTFFDGALEHLVAIRAAVTVPLLRKDFIVDEYQILEARASGADAILLIVAALAPEELRRLMRQAEQHGLATLVEVHDEGEIDVALEAGARLIGVNNRNLRTLEVSVEASERAIRRIPPSVVAVAESGLRTHDDLQRLSALGYRAFLVGERLMSSADPGRALAELVMGPSVRAARG